MRAIRGSEISDFLKDRFTWKLRWLDKLVPNKPQTALLTGTVMHKFLEAYYQTGDLIKSKDISYDLFQEEAFKAQLSDEEFIPVRDLLHNLTSNYYNQWHKQDSRIKVIATELTFRIPLDDEITYTGTIDLIYLDENDNLWIADHKTTKSIEGYEKNALLDRQISRYIWAVQQLTAGNGEIKLTSENGEKFFHPVRETIYWQERLLKHRLVHGFLYNLVLKEVPQPPKVLKKGGLSKDKSQYTTFELYKKAVEQLEEPHGVGVWVEYDDMLACLKAQETEFGNRYFKRVPVFRLQQEVDASMQDFYAAAQDLIQLEKEIQAGDESRVYMNITKDTAHNAYKHIIAATIAGENVELIKQTLYRVEEE